jgi:hypothetical protein
VRHPPLASSTTHLLRRRLRVCVDGRLAGGFCGRLQCLDCKAHHQRIHVQRQACELLLNVLQLCAQQQRLLRRAVCSRRTRMAAAAAAFSRRLLLQLPLWQHRRACLRARVLLLLRVTVSLRVAVSVAARACLFSHRGSSRASSIAGGCCLTLLGHQGCV